MQVLSGRITSTYWLYLFWIQVFLFSVARLDHKTKIVLLNTIFKVCFMHEKFNLLESTLTWQLDTV